VAATDPELHGHRADGADREAIGAVLESIGRVDWLVLALGGSGGVGPIASLDLDVLRQAYDVKFWGHITTIQAALPYLTPTASITLISAISARAGVPGTAGIASINGAVEALVRPLAVELAPMRVNAVSPGVVDTPWWSFLPEDLRKAQFAAAAEALPARHIATADDVAEAVVLAATNRNITGTVLETDAGSRLVTFF
jgi:NAD(P)-dependent dehydrogenase (short-subunit alcohol dehydrogenase family)